MKGPSGKIVTQFHGGITLYWLLLQVLRPLGSFGRRLGDRRKSASSPAPASGPISLEQARQREVLPD
jgi:hypothetical protein